MTDEVPELPATEAHAPTAPEPTPEPEPLAAPEPEESFADILADFDRAHKPKAQDGSAQLQGTVVTIDAERVFLDIGYKIEGVLPRAAFERDKVQVKAGDVIPVSIKGRTEDGYYNLSRFKVAQPHDWTALEEAFAQKLAVVGTVTGVVKGGLTVDLGVRAFMPASRSGTRDASEIEKLVGTEITCRITKLDTTEEDVVVDRRVVLEEQALAAAQDRLATLKEGDTVAGTVRSLTSYGAFVDLGGFDGLLHVSDIAWTRISKPEDALSVGQQIEVRILKIDPETKKLSLGLKQLTPEPWESVPLKYQPNQRVRGTVICLTDFGAFVELEPGVEGLIHISEMAWGKKVRHPSDVLNQGDWVDAVVLSIKPEERRLALGLKQTVTDPWSEIPQRFPVGAQVEGPVTKLMKFGAFVQIADGVEGLVHISEMVADRRLNHPSEVLREGQTVQAQVLGIDTAKRQIKLSMKQLIPTGLDEYLAEHKVGDAVSGRVVEVTNRRAIIELGEGVRGVCALKATEKEASSTTAAQAVDLSSLTSMLQARWKGNAPSSSAKTESLHEGQIRSFKIAKLDAAAKSIELELA